MPFLIPIGFLFWYYLLLSPYLGIFRICRRESGAYLEGLHEIEFQDHCNIAEVSLLSIELKVCITSDQMDMIYICVPTDDTTVTIVSNDVGKLLCEAQQESAHSILFSLRQAIFAFSSCRTQQTFIVARNNF